MSDFYGSVDHKGEFFHISHGDYHYTLGLDKNEMTMLGVIEVSYDTNIKYLLRDEQRGRSNKPRYRCVKDIPEDQRYVSLSFSEMRRRSIELCAESSFKHATPALERRGYIKTRFVRFEGGKIIKTYPCTGQCKSDNGEYWLNLYDWQGDDPREVVRACVRQYLLCPEVINADKRKLQGGPPDGPDNPEHDDDAPYYYEDMPETDQHDEQSVGKNTDLPTRGEPVHASSVGKFTDHAAEHPSFLPNDGGKNTDSLGKFTASRGKNTDNRGKFTYSSGKNTYSHAHSNKDNKDKNQSSESKKEPLSPHSHTDSSLTTEKTYPPLPEPGRLTVADVYQILAHYFGMPQAGPDQATNEQLYQKWDNAAAGLYAKLELAGLFESQPFFGPHAARQSLIRTLLYALLADKYWGEGNKGHPWLSPWIFEKHFEELLGKSAAWTPPDDYVADMACDDVHPDEQHAPIVIEVPIYVDESVQEVSYVDATPQKRSTPITEPLAPSEPEPEPQAYNELEAWCIAVGLPPHFAKPISRLTEAGYDVYANGDGTFGVARHGDTAYLPGYECVIASKLAFSVPLALCAKARQRTRSQASVA